MTNDKIVAAAVSAEAEKRGAIYAHLVLAALDGTQIAVSEGKAVAAEVKQRVAEVRDKYPELFRVQNAAKMNEDEFRALETELREPQLHAPRTIPDYVRGIDAAQLSGDELDALGRALAGTFDFVTVSAVERIARSQGLDTAPAAA